MFRTMKQFEGDVKKIEIRRDQEKKKHQLEVELISAQIIERRNVKKKKNEFQQNKHFEKISFLF